MLHAILYVCFKVPFCSQCVLHTQQGHLVVRVVASGGSVWTLEFPQDSVSAQCADTDEDNNTSVTSCCSLPPVAMCFLMTGPRVWWPPWIHCWCWIALCGSPQHCSAPPAAAGSHFLMLGMKWRCCRTKSWSPRGSVVRCPAPWTGTSSYEA